jgi:UDP-glucose 4-epimerase
MKYLIAGGAGFIGSHIADILIEMGHDVIIVDNLSTGKKNNIPNKATFVELDIAKSPIEILSSLFDGVTAVFHCAALPNVQFSIEQPLDSNKANVDTTIKILESMKIKKIHKIIYSSSCSIYGDAIQIPTTENETIKPLSPYALQKYIGEEYCALYHRLYNIEYVALRYFNVYGERMTDTGAYVSVLSHFLRAYKNNQALNITNTGEQKRDFIYVKDVARANVLAALKNTGGETILNLGSGNNYSINSIASWFNHNIVYGELRIEPFETLADINKAKNTLDWSPEMDLKSWVTQNI